MQIIYNAVNIITISNLDSLTHIMIKEQMNTFRVIISPVHAKCVGPASINTHRESVRCL